MLTHTPIPQAGIPGFFDPVAGVPKTLRIRYRFRGRAHYAEIPDYMPVVLPLKGTSNAVDRTPRCFRSRFGDVTLARARAQCGTGPIIIIIIGR